MTIEATTVVPDESSGDQLLAVMLAMAVGLFNGIRMTRLPDPEPSGAGEMILGG